jgi:PhnB protein
MQMNPHLSFNGQCKAAFKFYEKCLGGKIQTILAHEGTPIAQHVPAEWRSKILHATMIVDGHVLMGADAPPGRYHKPEGFAMTIGLNDTAKAERIFQELGENGTVTMPLQETFWAVRFGMLTDRFGIPWMINCEKAA